MAERPGARDRRSEPRVLLIGLCLALVLWLCDALLDAPRDGFAAGLADASSRGFLLRIATVLLIVGWAFYAQHLSDRHAAVRSALEREHQQLSLVYDNSPDAILVIDEDLIIRYANIRAAEQRGCPRAALTGRRCHELSGCVDGPCEGCRLQVVLRTGEVATAVRHRSEPDGKERWLEQTWYALPQDGGRRAVAEVSRDITAVRHAEDALHQSNAHLESRVRERTAALERANEVLSEEVTERRRMEKLLRESEERFRSIVELAPDLILVHIEGVVAFMNPIGAALLGYGNPADLIGREVLDLVIPEDQALAAEQVRKTVELHTPIGPLEMRFAKRDGTPITLEIAATPSTYHGRPAVQAVGHDITERKCAEETIRHMAYYDMLTGLPNRALFDDRLAVAINRADREGTSFALMFVDMNDFKRVNDSYGHATGDDLLAEVGRRLASATRKSDTVARFGGDEFTLLLPSERSREGATRVATKIIKAMRAPVMTSAGAVEVRMSIGIAFYPHDGRSLGELTHAADTAMYQAKSTELSFVFAEAPAGD